MLFDQRLGCRSRVLAEGSLSQTGADILVPPFLVPLAFVQFLARADKHCLRHDTSWHNVVGPDATVGQLSCDGQLIWSVEHLGADTYRAPKEALQVFRLGLQDLSTRAELGMNVACEVHIFAVFGHCPVQQPVLDRVHCSVVHLSVLLCLRPKQHMFLRKILVGRVRHSTDREPRIRECHVLRIHHQGPQAWKSGLLLGIFHEICNPLDGIKVLGVLRELRQSGEFEIEGSQFRKDCVSAGMNVQPFGGSKTSSIR